MKFEYPDDLVQARRDLDQINADLAALYEQLPWSVEPLPGWEREDRWSKVSFPDSPGWTDEQKAQVEELRARRLELVTTVLTHPYWDTLDSGVVAARSALKHIDDEAGEED